jgi:hypothetical protein
MRYYALFSWIKSHPIRVDSKSITFFSISLCSLAAHPSRSPRPLLHSPQRCRSLKRCHHVTSPPGTPSCRPLGRRRCCCQQIGHAAGQSPRCICLRVLERPSGFLRLLEVHLPTISGEALRDFLPVLIASQSVQGFFAGTYILYCYSGCAVIAVPAEQKPHHRPTCAPSLIPRGVGRCRTWYVTYTCYTLLILR